MLLRLLALLLGCAAAAEAGGRAVVEVKTHSDFNKLLKHHKEKTGMPVIVDFFSVSCGPCQMIKPVYKRIAEEFKGRAFFATVDVNTNQETSQREQVRSMPTFKFYLNGKVYKQFSGADERQLRSLTQEIVRKAQAMNVEVTAESLTEFFTEHAPEKVSKVTSILAKFPADKLVKNLKEKYGKAPKTTKKKAYNPKVEKKKKESVLMHAALEKASDEDLQHELQRRTNDKDEDELEEMMNSPKAWKSKPNKLVVIGAGPAGLATAVYAARAGLSPVVVAPPVGGQLMGKGVEVENYPGVDGSTGAQPAAHPENPPIAAARRGLRPCSLTRCYRGGRAQDRAPDAHTGLRLRDALRVRHGDACRPLRATLQGAPTSRPLLLQPCEIRPKVYSSAVGVLQGQLTRACRRLPDHAHRSPPTAVRSPRSPS